MARDVTVARLNLESSDVLLAPAHVAFLVLGSFHTVPFLFFDCLLLPSLNFVSGQISTFLQHLFFFFSEVTTPQGPRCDCSRGIGEGKGPAACGYNPSSRAVLGEKAGLTLDS